MKLNLQKKIVLDDASNVLKQCKSVYDGKDAIITLEKLSHSLQDCVSIYKSRLVHSCSLSPISIGVHTSAGKSFNEEQAKLAALAESIERLCLEYNGQKMLKSAYNEIQNKAILPNSYQLFSSKQFLASQKFNTKFPRQKIAQDLDKALHIEWTAVYSLIKQKYFYLPSADCFFMPPHLQTFFAAPSSNGTSAAETLEQAAFNGFLELVERDCIAIWWYNRLRLPKVKILDNKILNLKKKYEDLNCKVWALDLTMDWNIPVYAVLCAKNSGEILMGFGADTTASKALQKAFLELTQVYAAFELGFYKKDRAIKNWIKNFSLEKNSWLKGEKVATFKDASLNNLEDILRLVKSKNLDFLVLNLSQKKLPLKVVKIFVPGMRPMQARFAPGRLYDVALELGFLKQTLSEEELNPQPIIF